MSWSNLVGSAKERRLAWLLVAALLLVIIPIATRPAKASDFEEAYLRFSRMKASEATNVLAVFKVPAGNTGTEAYVDIDFGSGTTVCTGSTTVSTTGLPGGVTALPGTLTAAGSSQTVTVSGVTNLSASTTYGFFINGCITNGDAAAYTHVIRTETSGNSEIDSKEVSGRVISNDQITVNASVPPTFSFTFGGNTMDFTGDLDVSSIVSTNGILITIATNAGNGWIAWALSANAALTSASTGDSIASSGTVNGTPTTLSAGSEDYALDVDLTQDSGTAGTGTVTINAEYDGGASQGGTLATSFNPIASANGPTDDDRITLVAKATISALTQAATDYTDTLTVVGAGNF